MRNISLHENTWKLLFAQRFPDVRAARASDENWLRENDGTVRS